MVPEAPRPGGGVRIWARFFNQIAPKQPVNNNQTSPYIAITRLLHAFYALNAWRGVPAPVQHRTQHRTRHAPAGTSREPACQ